MPLTEDGMIVTGGISYKLNGVEVAQEEYIQETNRRFKEYHSKLLTEFMTWLNLNKYDGNDLECYIESFLNHYDDKE